MELTLCKITRPGRFKCSARGQDHAWPCLAKQMQSVVQTLPKGASRDQQEWRSDVMRKSCPWDAASGQRKTIIRPLHQAGQCQVPSTGLLQCAAAHESVGDLTVSQPDWAGCWSHVFIHPHWENTVKTICHFIQAFRVHHYPLLSVFSTDIQGKKKKRHEVCKNVYDTSLLKRRRCFCAKDSLLDFG